MDIALARAAAHEYMYRMTKQAVFTREQNAALRQALIALKYPSQAAAAEALGIEQQNASRLLRDQGGFSYATATRVAQLAGFDGVDSFFAAKVRPDSTTNVTDPDSLDRAG